EGQALYDLMENEVAARFYSRDAAGVPRRWMAMVRHTLATLGPKVQATRMVTDYVQNLYAPAAHAGRALNGPSFDGARELAGWKRRVREGWSQVGVDHVESAGVGQVAQLGDVLQVRAYVALGELSPEDVEVQVVHGRASESDEIAVAGVAP